MSPIYRFGPESIEALPGTTFEALGVAERHDLQRLLRGSIEVVAPDVLVIAEEFGQWADSRRRIDLLGVDRDANLVVIELKRTEDGGHMELQSIRYASMVSTLTAAQAVAALGAHLQERDRDEDPEELLLEHLGWSELDEESFGQDVRIVLVSADFSRELTTAVMWLNEKDLDVRCVRIRPYQDHGRTLIDVQQIIPLPEASDYQVQVREKRRQEREARRAAKDLTRYDVTVSGETYRCQWKRNAILLVVRAIVESGVSPLELDAFFETLGRHNAFLSVAEETESVDRFHALAAGDARARGKAYKPARWHAKPGKLMPHQGRTYAFTNQWGARWPSFMEALRERYPAIGLRFAPMEAQEAA